MAFFSLDCDDNKTTAHMTKKKKSLKCILSMV